jgi:hypothetical protein
MERIREFLEYTVNASIVAALPSWLIIYIFNNITGWNVSYWFVLLPIGIAIGYQYAKDGK